MTNNGPFFYPSKKSFLSPLVWPRREYTRKPKGKGSLLICFWNCQGVPYSHRESRNRMMNIFLKVNFLSTRENWCPRTSAFEFHSFTYIIISNRLVKFNMEIKCNIFSVFELLKVVSVIQDFHFSNDASSNNN